MEEENRKTKKKKRRLYGSENDLKSTGVERWKKKKAENRSAWAVGGTG